VKLLIGFVFLLNSSSSSILSLFAFVFAACVAIFVLLFCPVHPHALLDLDFVSLRAWTLSSSLFVPSVPLSLTYVPVDPCDVGINRIMSMPCIPVHTTTCAAKTVQCMTYHTRISLIWPQSEP